ARPDGISDEEYKKKQLELMENSQEAALVVAFEEADADIDITYNGVYVLGTVEGMPADDILEVGDLITKVDDIDVNKANDLMKYVKNKKRNTEIERKFEPEKNNYTK